MANIYIYKYTFNHSDSLIINNVKKILHFAFQDNIPMVWAEVGGDHGDDYVCRYFMTGETVPDGYEHFGTDMTKDHRFVAHLYMRKV